MNRRELLVGGSFLGGLAATASAKPAFAHEPAPTSATGRPIRILMGGYGPSQTSFSRGLKMIGDRLEARFPDDVEVHYLYNISELGYTGADLRWLVGDGVFAMGYLTMTSDVPELQLASLPFIFPDSQSARAAMDGELGARIISGIQEKSNYTVLGFFENGFRHVSNNVRRVVTPADLQGLEIRTLGTESLVRTFELLGAIPRPMPLGQAIGLIENGSLDGQENPFANTVTYKLHPWQRFHTTTQHAYFSRPIFVHRPSFDAWPREVRDEIRNAATDAVQLQRKLHDEEEAAAARIIQESGGEIVELTPVQLAPFKEAVAPIYDDARNTFSRAQLELVGL